MEEEISERFMEKFFATVAPAALTYESAATDAEATVSATPTTRTTSEHKLSGEVEDSAQLKTSRD